MAQSLVKFLVVLLCIAAIQAGPPNRFKRTRLGRRTSDISDSSPREKATDGIEQAVQELKEEGLSDKAELVIDAAGAAKEATQDLVEELSNDVADAVATAVADVITEQEKPHSEHADVEGKKDKSEGEQPTRRNLNKNTNFNYNNNINDIIHRLRKRPREDNDIFGREDEDDLGHYGPVEGEKEYSPFGIDDDDDEDEEEEDDDDEEEDDDIFDIPDLETGTASVRDRFPEFARARPLTSYRAARRTPGSRNNNMNKNSNSNQNGRAARRALGGKRNFRSKKIAQERIYKSRPSSRYY